MKVKTNELTDLALDWAVAKCEERPHSYAVTGQPPFTAVVFTPSTDWAQGGAIIEREKISLEHLYGAGDAGADVWVAAVTCADKKFGGVERFEEEGPTPLVAAMRCYVASKLGNEVEVPDELTTQTI